MKEKLISNLILFTVITGAIVAGFKVNEIINKAKMPATAK